MPKGRNPKVIQDNEVSRKTKDDVQSIQDNTPVYESQNFIPPQTLNEKELEVWNWLVNIFRQTVGCMVSDADVHLMELYCRAKVAADEADAAIKKHPSEFILVDAGVDKNGVKKKVIKPNPNYKKRKENAELCLKFFDQLGLSPLARARIGIKAANAKKEQDIYAMLNSRSD